MKQTDVDKKPAKGKTVENNVVIRSLTERSVKSMQDYKEALKAQLKEIDSLISRSESSLTGIQNPDNLGIAVSRSNNHDQYYWVDKASQKRKYVKSNEIETMKKVAQRDYDAKVIKKLRHIRKALSEFLEQYDIAEIDMAYSGMAAARKKLVTPVADPLEILIEKWKSVKYEMMPINENTEFYSNDGVRVRSKSELIIANLLEQNRVPYRYEFPLTLKSGGNVRPDFLCLNTRTRKEYIWEHFGMMDNIAYANSNVVKINLYGQNDYFVGKNLIMTFETSQHAIGSTMIKAMIRQYLL